MKYKIKKLFPLLGFLFLVLLIIGIVFLVRETIFMKKAEIALAEDSSDYLYQVKNTKNFLVQFGRKNNPQEIVFEKDKSVIKINLPVDVESGGVSWEISGDKLEAKTQGRRYLYSIIKNEQNQKPIGIKEEIVLSQKPASETFEFPVKLIDLKPRRVKGLWRFFDQDGQEKFFIPKPFMDDASGAHSERVGIEIEKRGSQHVIIIRPDGNWLNDPKRVYPVVIDPSLETNDQPYQELKEKRSLKSRFYSNGDGTEIMQAFAGYIYYEDKETKELKEIDTTLLPSEYGWEMRKANYEVMIPRYADEWFKFINSSQIDYETGEDLFTPEEEINLRALGVKKVEGFLMTNTLDPWKYRKVVYQGAYNEHTDLELVARDSIFDKLIVIRQEPVDLSHDLEFSFELDFPQRAEVKFKENNNLKTWSENEPLITSNSVLIEKLRKTWFRYFQVWDSADNIEPIKVRLEKKNNKYILTKIIPKEFLKNAVYPVTTDADQYLADCAGGDDIGHITKQGSGNDRWDLTHNAINGDSTVICGGTGNFVWTKDIGGATKISDIARAFIPIDTSGIVDASDISAATLNVYVNALVGNSTYNIVQTTQLDVTTLTIADYDLCGAIHSATVGAAAVTPSASSRAVFILNATGRGWISDSGYTKLGIRDVEHDLADVRPANAEENKMSFDDDSTPNDPYLEITIGAPPNPATGTGLIKTLIRAGVRIRGGVIIR